MAQASSSVESPQYAACRVVYQKRRGSRLPLNDSEFALGLGRGVVCALLAAVAINPDDSRLVPTPGRIEHLRYPPGRAARVRSVLVRFPNARQVSVPPPDFVVFELLQLEQARLSDWAAVAEAALGCVIKTIITQRPDRWDQHALWIKGGTGRAPSLPSVLGVVKKHFDQHNEPPRSIDAIARHVGLLGDSVLGGITMSLQTPVSVGWEAGGHQLTYGQVVVPAEQVVE